MNLLGSSVPTVLKLGARQHLILRSRTKVRPLLAESRCPFPTPPLIGRWKANIVGVVLRAPVYRIVFLTIVWRLTRTLLKQFTVMVAFPLGRASGSGVNRETTRTGSALPTV